MALMSDILRDISDAEYAEQAATKRGAQSTARRSKAPRESE